MYKTHIKQWGLDKKNKENEMRVIVRNKQQMDDQGKASAFRIRGRLVDYRDVVRYWERKGVRIEDVIAQRTKSVTPEAVKCFTAPQSPITTPESIAIPERILVSTRDYFHGSFESGTWLVTDPQRSCKTTKTEEDTLNDVNALYVQFMTACDLLNENCFPEGGQIMISATASIEKILLAEDPMTLTYLLTLFASLCRRRRHEIVLVILRQISALAKILKGKMHLLRSICSWLASLDQSRLEDFVVRSSRSVVDHFENILGHIHWSALISRLTFIQEIDFRQEMSHTRFLLQDLLRELEATLGSLDLRTCEVRRYLACIYSRDLKHVEAIRLGYDIAALAQRLYNLDDRTYHYAQGLSIVATSLYDLGETHSAEENLREAINLRTSRRGPKDSRVAMWLLILDGWLVGQGQLSSAAQLQGRRKKTLEGSTDDN